MTELLLSVLAGFLIGLAFALVFFRFLDEKRVEKECLSANLKLYREILLKKQNKSFQYSPVIRKAINHVHASLLFEHQNTQMDEVVPEKKEPSF